MSPAGLASEAGVRQSQRIYDRQYIVSELIGEVSVRRLAGGTARLDFTARVLAASDVYEALTADRPYRDGTTVEKTLGIMRPDRGTAFDSVTLDATASRGEQGTLAMLAASPDDAIGRLSSPAANVGERAMRLA